jgi:hypothetical protein
MIFSRLFVDPRKVEEDIACFDFEDELRTSVARSTFNGMRLENSQRTVLSYPAIDEMTTNSLLAAQKAGVVCSKVSGPVNGYAFVSVVVSNSSLL